MTPEYSVTVLDFEILEEIEGAWTAAAFIELLEAMDFTDTAGLSDEELREMTILALQDLEPEAAAGLVLTQHLGTRLNAGQIRNAAADMPDEKLWEQFADLSLHEGMFNVGSILYAAFPALFPQPDAVHLRLEVSAATDAGKAVLRKPLHESFLVRLLADGMDDSSVLCRVFEEQLHAPSFPEADKVVWIVEAKTSEGVCTVEVTSSGYWLDPLRGTKSYESRAYADRPRETDGEPAHDPAGGR